ncbi:MAG: MotA/TolQ/ExbB proton channel family protein [Lachnospiraceae bacterium]|nr:MotA/TolQ/ExbB proton channel family protein [Lachnospiraceae bacterium]
MAIKIEKEEEEMYLLSVICVILLTAVMCGTWGVTGSSMLYRFCDFSTIIFLVLFLVPLLISGGLLKDFSNAFRLVIGKKEAGSLQELKRAKEAVSLTIKIMVVVSVFICAIQGIFIIYSMDDLAKLGPSFSVALLSLIYGMGTALVLLPLQARLNVKIQEFISEKE